MAQSHILQVVNGDGEFNESGVEHFIRQHSISDAGVGYQVVAITGPQSSGKSTLMNAVVSIVIAVHELEIEQEYALAQDLVNVDEIL